MEIVTTARLSFGVALLLTLLSACGGSGSAGSATSGSSSSSSISGTSSSSGPSSSSGASSSSSSSSGTTGSQSFNPDADIAAINAAYGALPHTNPAADATAMLAMVQGLADVQSSGQSNPYTVWLIYKDGSMHTIVTLPTVPQANAPPLTSSAAAATLAKPPTETAGVASRETQDAVLPQGRIAYIYSALTANYTDKQLDDPIANLQTWFGQNGYQVETAVLASPTDLHNIKNASVFYIDTHGGVGVTKNGELVFEIAVPQEYSKAARQEYQREIDDNEMGYLSVAAWYEDLGALMGKRLRLANYLFITPEFIAKNMTFASNSLVFINGCEALSQTIPQAQALVNTFHTLGVPYVVGWDNVVNAAASADSALYLFDRMLGTNSYAAYPASPPLRPFNYGAVFLDMTTRPHRADVLKAIYGVQTQPLPLSKSYYSTLTIWGADLSALGIPPIAAGANLRMDVANKSIPTLALVPSISAVRLLNNSDTLILEGDFGTNTQNGILSIGGTNVAATSWTSSQIEVNGLPRSGAGSSGNVAVTVDGAVSNHVLLNRWPGVLLNMVTNSGPSTQLTVTCSVNLRASFASLRQGPGLAPDTEAVTTDNGVVQDSEGCAFTAINPNGSGNIPWVNPYELNGQPYPATGATAFATGPIQNLQGGGAMELSLEAAYCKGVVFCFDETAATSSNGMIFDDSTENLGAGSATQASTLLGWSDAPGLLPDPNYAR